MSVHARVCIKLPISNYIPKIFHKTCFFLFTRSVSMSLFLMKYYTIKTDVIINNSWSNSTALKPLTETSVTNIESIYTYIYVWKYIYIYIYTIYIYVCIIIINKYIYIYIYIYIYNSWNIVCTWFDTYPQSNLVRTNTLIIYIYIDIFQNE